MAINEAEILQALNLGTSKQVLENKGNSPLSRLLSELCEGVIDELKVALQNRNINTSSMGLSQSLHTNGIQFSGDGVQVSISAEFYWKFVNYGVNGTEISHGAPEWGPSPPGELSFKDAILQWIPQRGLQLPPEFSSFESFAYAIMTNKRKKGQEPRPFYDDVVNERLVDVMRGPIEALIGRSIALTVVSPFQNR